MGVSYYEEWTERVTHTTTDSKGNTETHTTYVYHPPYWTAPNQYGEDSISKASYNKWKNIWGNEKKVGVFNLNQSSWGDGDKFVSEWTGKFEEMLPLSSVHSYENKIRSTDNVWAYKEITDKDLLEKFKRPADRGDTSPILGFGISIKNEDRLFLERTNAKLGPIYEIHTIAILFNYEEYPNRDIVETILNIWKGPNKNELVSFIGIDKDNNIKWAETTSWMDDTSIHSLIRQDLIALNKWEVKGYGDVLWNRVQSNWKRKEFEDFSYIKTNLPIGIVMIEILSIIIVCVLVVIIVNKNRM